jgi:hypothetical protein
VCEDFIEKEGIEAEVKFYSFSKRGKWLDTRTSIGP